MSTKIYRFICKYKKLFVCMRFPLSSCLTIDFHRICAFLPCFRFFFYCFSKEKKVINKIMRSKNPRKMRVQCIVIIRNLILFAFVLG